MSHFELHAKIESIVMQLPTMYRWLLVTRIEVICV